MASRWIKFEESVEYDISNSEAGNTFLAEYQLIKKIHKGQLSHVYIIHNKDTQEPYILKAINKSQCVCYVDLMKKVSHPNIVKVHDIFETEKYIYIRKEFIKGDTLESFIKKNGPLNEHAVIKIALQLCEILTYLHSMDSSPVIYRDLKPANIMINENGNITLIDLDSVRQYKEDANNDTVYIGTEGFASPEQYGYGQTDIRSDIYTFGATLYYLLTDMKPVADKLNHDNIRKIRPDISISLGKIIEKCTRFNPDNRYQNIHQLQKELMGISSKNYPVRLIYRLKLTFPKKAAAIVSAAALMTVLIFLIYWSGNSTEPFSNIPAEQADILKTEPGIGVSQKADDKKEEPKINLIDYREYVGIYAPGFELDKLNLKNKAITDIQLVKDGMVIPMIFNISENRLLLINDHKYENLLDVENEYSLEVTTSDNSIYSIVFTPDYQELEEFENQKIYYVPAKPDKGFNFPYYMILPSEESIERNKGKKNYLLVEPYYMGEYSDNLARHLELAFENEKINSAAIAEELGLPRIIPVFTLPESKYRNREIYTHILNRNAIFLDQIMQDVNDEEESIFSKLKRIDQQLIEMIKDANLILESRGWIMEDKIFLWGKEEAGHFANRFTFLHPDRVKAVIYQGLPILFIPSYEGNTLPYPFGCADYMDITGREFSQDEYNRVAKLSFIYTQNYMENLYQDAIDYINSPYLYRLLQYDEYPGKWQFVRNIYKDTGMQLQVNLYEDDSLLAMDSVSFFKENRDSDMPVYLASNDTELAKTVIITEQQEKVIGNVSGDRIVEKATINEAFWSGTMPKTLSDEFISFYTRTNLWKYNSNVFFISIQEWDDLKDHKQMAERIYLYGGEITLKAKGYNDVKARMTEGSMTCWNEGYIYFVELINAEDMVSGVRYNLVDDSGNWIINKGVTVERPENP